MLILTRRPNETIMLGDDIRITVLGIQGNQARIGVNAPKNVPVHREEIYQRIQRENPQALQNNCISCTFCGRYIEKAQLQRAELIGTIAGQVALLRQMGRQLHFMQTNDPDSSQPVMQLLDFSASTGSCEVLLAVCTPTDEQLRRVIAILEERTEQAVKRAQGKAFTAGGAV